MLPQCRNVSCQMGEPFKLTQSIYPTVVSVSESFCNGISKLQTKIKWELISRCLLADLPTIAVEPKEVTLDVSNDTTAICRGSGNPQARVFWQISDIRANYTITNISNNVIQLHLFNVSAWDTGAYMCFSENEAGHVNASWMVYVKCELSHAYLYWV